MEAVHPTPHVACRLLNTPALEVSPVVKLTRLNRATVVINPDHITWVDAAPDTTLCLLGGEKIIVRETVDELIDKVIEFRQAIAMGLQDFEHGASLASIVAARNVLASGHRPSSTPVTGEGSRP